MQLVYTISHNYESKFTHECEQFLQDSASLCVVSVKNIVAFTTRVDLREESDVSVGSRVYAADLNTPWNVHKITSRQTNVTVLEWNQTGEMLLIADFMGETNIWKCYRHCFNEWTCVGTVSAGEPIITAAFSHNGMKTSICREKTGDTLYCDKFRNENIFPSIKKFGNLSVDGCILISSTGMITAAVLTNETKCTINTSPQNTCNVPQLKTAQAFLGLSPSKIIVADVCYEKNGQFLFALVRTSVGQPIEFVRVTVKEQPYRLSVEAQRLPTFQQLGPGRSRGTLLQTVQLKFADRENSELLVVSFNCAIPPMISEKRYYSQGDILYGNKNKIFIGGHFIDLNGGVVEVWKVNENEMPIHKLFTSDAPKTVRAMNLQLQSAYMTSCSISCMTVSKLYPPFYIIVSLIDGSLLCLNRDSLERVALLSPIGSNNHNLGFSKRHCHLDTSPLGRVLTAIDTLGQLNVFKLPSLLEQGSEDLLLNDVCLLEFCLVTGFDYWDLLICMKREMLETVIDNFCKRFSQQPTSVQQYHCTRFLNIKICLLKLSATSSKIASDLECVRFLNSIESFFHACLRPLDIEEDSQWPKNIFETVMSDPLYDIESGIDHQEIQNFEVSIRHFPCILPLIDWITTVASQLVIRLGGLKMNGDGVSEEYNSYYSINYDLLKDSKNISRICELLFIIIVWWSLQEYWLQPHGTDVNNVTMLQSLFKHLSQWVRSSNVDEDLMNTCRLLRQIYMKDFDASSRFAAVVTQELLEQRLPLLLEYGEEPNNEFSEDLDFMDSFHGVGMFDSVSKREIRKHEIVWKQCSRCGERTVLVKSAAVVPISGWDLRWYRSCLCGGTWHKRNSRHFEHSLS